MRRLFAVLLVAIVGTTLPAGQPHVIAADPSASQASESPLPSLEVAPGSTPGPSLVPAQPTEPPAAPSTSAGASVPAVEAESPSPTPPPYPTSVSLTATPNPVLRNTLMELEAVVTPDPGPGTVEFRIDGELVGTDTLSGGVATHSAVFVALGYHVATATFSGNADWSPRTSDILALNVVGDPVGLTLTLPADPLPAGPVTLTAALSPDPGGGIIRWAWKTWGNPTDLPVGPGGVTLIDLGNLAAGRYGIQVEFLGSGTLARTSADLFFFVKGPSSTTVSASRGSATVGELPVVLTATVTTGPVVGGSVSFLDDVNGALVELGTVAVDGTSGTASYSSNALRIGTHTIWARYNGMDETMPSTSDPVTVTVARDSAVHATFQPSLAKFYPYRDRFKDSVSLRGVLDEKATVTIRVYSSSGALKRTWSLGTKGAGGYSANWNGRTAGGTALPAGKYKVKASFKDARGNTRTITAYTTTSWRQATWKSATVVRYGDQLTYAADAADGRLFYSPDYARGRTLFSAYFNHNCSPNCAWITGTAAFTLSSSALAYRSARIGVEGHTYEDHNAGTAFIVRPGTGAWEVPFSLPDYPRLGWGSPVSTTYISPTRQVRIVLWCSEEQGAAFDAHYLKLTYQYAVWR